MRTLVMALLILPTSAMAQQIDLTLNQTAQDLGLDEAALESELNAAAADTLKLDNPGSFAQSMAEAAALSTKGLGVDYASNFKKFVVGGAIASSAHEAGFTFKKGEQTLPKGGYAAQLSLMAGLNLGLGGKENGFLDRFRLFANGLALRLPSNREFGGQMGNIGAHLQLKLIGGINAKVTEWGGIDLTSGIEHTTYTFALRQGLPIEAPISGGSAQWTADGTYDVSTTSTSGSSSPALWTRGLPSRRRRHTSRRTSKRSRGQRRKGSSRPICGVAAPGPKSQKKQKHCCLSSTGDRRSMLGSP